MNEFRLFSCMLLLTTAIACKKDSESSGGPAVQPKTPAVKIAPAPAPAAAALPVETALQHLNTAVRNYYADKLEMPATLEDVYRTGYAKERFAPPAGKQFHINPQTRTVEVK